MAGWLGAAAPENFVIDISMERPLPCHKSIDYDRPGWEGRWERGEEGRMCTGSLIFSANICKIPRDKHIPRRSPDKIEVFATPTEFIDHHRSSPVRSWETKESFELRKK
jgi:hypothetical protein